MRWPSRNSRPHLLNSPAAATRLARISHCHRLLGHYVQARQAAEEAIAADPGWAWGHYALAWAFYGDQHFACRREGEVSPRGRGAVPWHHRYTFAQSSICEAIRLDPANANFFLLKSMILFDAGKVIESQAAADAGLTLDPVNAGCLRMKALALRYFGDAVGAQAASFAALAQEPQSALSHASAGWTSMQARRYPAARYHFMEALRIDPGLLTAKKGLLGALRAQYAFYRPLLWVGSWRGPMRKRRWAPGAMRMALVVVGAIAGAVLSQPGNSAWGRAPALALIAALWIMAAAFFLTSYLLQFDPVGHHLLRPSDRSSALLFLTISTLLLPGIALAAPANPMSSAVRVGIAVLEPILLLALVAGAVVIPRRRRAFQEHMALP